MFSLHLFRCSKQPFFIKSVCKKNVHSKLINSTIAFSSGIEKRNFSNLSKNQPQSILSAKLHVPLLLDERHLRIPPTNKDELNECLTAFKTELFKFSVKDLKDSPKTHLTYGTLGLLPFILPPVQMLLFGYMDGVVWLQLAYGATILSYLGGVQWGATIPDSSKNLPSWETIGVSVAPQLIAWIALTLPIPLGIMTTGTALTATLAMDLLKFNYPPWFKSLRIFLTMGAVGSLVATLFGYVLA